MDNYEKMQGFVKKFIDGLDISQTKTHAAFLTFSNNPSLQFDLDDDFNPSTLKLFVDRVSHSGGQTYIDRALEKASSKIFNESYGWRQNVSSVSKITIKWTSNWKLSWRPMIGQISANGWWPIEISVLTTLMATVIYIVKGIIQIVLKISRDLVHSHQSPLICLRRSVTFIRGNVAIQVIVHLIQMSLALQWFFRNLSEQTVTGTLLVDSPCG